MISSAEFEAAGFTPSQTTLLQRAFEVIERTSAQRFSLLQEAMNQGFAGQALVLDTITRTLERMDNRMDQMDGRLDQMDGRLDQMDGRLDQMDGRLGRIEATLRDMQPPERRN